VCACIAYRPVWAWPVVTSWLDCISGPGDTGWRTAVHAWVQVGEPLYCCLHALHGAPSPPLFGVYDYVVRAHMTHRRRFCTHARACMHMQSAPRSTRHYVSLEARAKNPSTHSNEVLCAPEYVPLLLRTLVMHQYPAGQVPH